MQVTLYISLVIIYSTSQYTGCEKMNLPPGAIVAAEFDATLCDEAPLQRVLWIRPGV
jgi:hypothetical protein